MTSVVTSASLSVIAAAPVIVELGCDARACGQHQQRKSSTWTPTATTAFLFLLYFQPASIWRMGLLPAEAARPRSLRRRGLDHGICIILSFIISMGTRSLEVRTTGVVALFSHPCSR